MTTGFDGLLHSIRDSYERSLDAISQAVKDGRNLSVEATSSSGQVLVGLKGDYGVTAVVIAEEDFDKQDSDGLADAVLSAYANAASRLRQEQRHTVLGCVFEIERNER